MLKHMSKATVSKFLKSYDRYAKPVTLTFQKQGGYRTEAGGVLSIISFILLFYYLVVNVWYAFADYGTYTSSSQTKLMSSGDEYPLIEMQPEQFNVAYQTFSVDVHLIADLSQYVQGVWVQLNGDIGRTYEVYLPVDCTEVYS